MERLPYNFFLFPYTKPGILYTQVPGFHFTIFCNSSPLLIHKLPVFIIFETIPSHSL